MDKSRIVIRTDLVINAIETLQPVLSIWRDMVHQIETLYGYPIPKYDIFEDIPEYLGYHAAADGDPLKASKAIFAIHKAWLESHMIMMKVMELNPELVPLINQFMVPSRLKAEDNISNLIHMINNSIEHYEEKGGDVDSLLGKTDALLIFSYLDDTREELIAAELQLTHMSSESTFNTKH